MKGRVPSGNDIMAAVLGVILLTALITPVKTTLYAIPNMSATELAIVGLVSLAMLFGAIQMVMSLVESRRK